MQAQTIAVIGSGIAGLSAAWLLGQRHRVTLYEQAGRLGGHINTVMLPGGVPADIGFIVYNEPAYPNLTALFAHLGVAARATGMSFAVAHPGMEYGTADLRGLLAAPANLWRPRFWSMLRDLARFYREAPRDLPALSESLQSLGEYLAANRYGKAFIEDHLLPMTAAVWSTPAARAADYPAASFIRFCLNHGLLQLTGRPQWRTVIGGSQSYVARLMADFTGEVRLGCGAVSVAREGDAVAVRDSWGETRRFGQVAVATHSDQALAMLADPSEDERSVLGALRYSPNTAFLHTDARLMPGRRAAWSAWNYLGAADGGMPCVTYWLNRLQDLPAGQDWFLTLNPVRPPAPEAVLHTEHFAHPAYDAAALRAQRALWRLQGARRTWYCGAYFGAGFHEDGLQAGLAVAEAIGGVRRPWQVAEESGRIVLGPAPRQAREAVAA